MKDHDKIYTTSLMIVAFIWFAGAGSVMVIMPGGSTRNLIVFMYAALILLTLITLTLRLKKSPHARLITKAANCIYLPFVPFGTAVGIYGLLKVDKKAKPEFQP